MIALIRKNLRLWGYGKSLALFTGCILFSISGRLNGGIAYERHILSAVSDHYYLTYFVLPIVLLSCFSFIDDDGEPVILRFQSYHSYFLKKWIGVGLIAVILTAVQTGAILLSGIGLPLGNEWNLAAGATEAELFSALEQLFASPLQAFVCFTLYQLIGSWLIFGICMWIGHFTGRKWTIRIVIVLYVLSAVWIKLPAIQNIPLTSFNHLLILHHNFGEPARPWSTGFTLLLFMLTIMFSVRFAWRGHLPQLRLKCHGIAAYYSYELMTKRNILILLAVVVGITLYKGLGYGAAESDAEWIYSLFAGHGTGYFQVFPFLEMLITSGVPLYLLAAFVEHTVNGQSIFISVRAKSRRHLVNGILSVSTKFLIIYAFFWLMAGLIGASLFSTGLTIVSFRLMLYAVLMKCLDILVQYLIVLGIYIATRQVTIGFLVLVAGNLLCILPGNWVAYSPFGLSSLTRISVVEPGIGISAVSAFGIEATILTLMIAGILMWGYAKYIALRPRAERLGEHGLFGDDDAVDLAAVADELDHYTGNVWTHIISLHREDAERLGYNHADAWRTLLRTHRNDIAAAMKIPPGDFRWYAAFHDEGNHPHVHMMAWSVKPNQAYTHATRQKQDEAAQTMGSFMAQVM